MWPIGFGSFNSQMIRACSVKKAAGFCALCDGSGDATLKREGRKLESENCGENGKKFHTKKRASITAY